MNILVTNDDGYDSPGLTTLVDILSKEHSVYVLAPDRNRSAVSNHITMFKDTGIEKIKDKVYSCQGYPADCAAIGLTSGLFDVKFDLLISGINLGGNLGTDIVYSGTCAAARQAVLNKIPSIALSIQPLTYDVEKIDYKFHTLANFVLKNLDQLKKLSSTENPRTFVNINAVPMDSYKGIKFSKELCIKEYGDDLKIEEKDGKLVSVFRPNYHKVQVNYPEESDISLTNKGYVNISIVFTDPFCNSVDDVKLVL